MRDGRTPYFHNLRAMLLFMDDRARTFCQTILEQEHAIITAAPGSKHNHQAWPGGYVDHITEVMNIAIELYKTLNALRPLSFTLSDALFVLFLHDIEKPFRFEFAEDGTIVEKEGIISRNDKKFFRKGFFARYGIELTPEQENAMTNVEGEIDRYSSTERVMNPLAAFCHLCDVSSARIWFDHPLAEGEKLLGSRRSKRN